MTEPEYHPQIPQTARSVALSEVEGSPEYHPQIPQTHEDSGSGQVMMNIP